METAVRVFDTNFWGVVRVINAVLPTMRKQRSGLVINVGSLAGVVGVPGQGFYAASKHALDVPSATAYRQSAPPALGPRHQGKRRLEWSSEGGAIWLLTLSGNS